MSEEYKACPFCGEAATQDVGASNIKFAYCMVCFSDGPSARSEDDARSAWNTRPLEDALQAELTKLAALESQMACGHEGRYSWPPVVHADPDDERQPTRYCLKCAYDATADQLTRSMDDELRMAGICARTNDENTTLRALYVQMSCGHESRYLYPVIEDGYENHYCLMCAFNLTSHHLVESREHQKITADFATKVDEEKAAMVQEIATVTKDRDDWKRESNMFDKAWGRELKTVVPKTHRIDSLVITTRRIVEENETLRAENARLADEAERLRNLKGREE